MKTELSSLEIRVLADELKGIVGARIQKIFQEKNMMHLSMHVPGQGTKTLLIGDGKIFLSKYRLVHSDVPTNFAMYLRKYCKNQKIKNIYQHDFERIVIIEMDGYKLIVELFSKGNVIFADRDNSIWSVLERQLWSSRKIKQKEAYQFPPRGIDPTALAEEVFLKALQNSDKQIVAFLARELSLGGTFAEEVCIMAKIEKKKTCNTFTKKESDSILSAIGKLFSRDKKAQIVLENGVEIDVLPFDVSRYKGKVYEKRYYEKFYDAVDDFFVKKMAEIDAGTENKVVSVKKDKLTKRLESQKEAIGKLQKSEADSVKKAELIYEHYTSFEKLIDAVLKQGIGNAGKIAKEIISADQKAKTITVDVKGVPVSINMAISLNENANAYYGMAKKAREKVKNAGIALLETERKMAEAKEVVATEAKIDKKVEALKWFHKFRWFVSSGGFVVVGGKDATSNEVLIKKHLEEKDIVFHADITGSPFVVVKTGGKDVDQKTLDEAAQFTGMYSRAWKVNVGVAEVYHVMPDQVSKTAPSGEFITKGSFMIYGKKNIMKVELRLGVGFRDGEIITGPEKMISAATKKNVVIEPGDEGAAALSKKVKAELFSKCSKEEQEILRKMSADVIARAIPFGTGRIV